MMLSTRTNDLVAFGVTMKTGHNDTAAILEWVIAFLFTFFVASFAIDFLPAIRTRHKRNIFAIEKGNMQDTPNQLGGPSGYSSNDEAETGTARESKTPSRNF